LAVRRFLLMAEEMVSSLNLPADKCTPPLIDEPAVPLFPGVVRITYLF